MKYKIINRGYLIGYYYPSIKYRKHRSHLITAIGNNFFMHDLIDYLPDNKKYYKKVIVSIAYIDIIKTSIEASIKNPFRRTSEYNYSYN